MKKTDRFFRWAALLSLIPVLGFPLSNPDLFWHLSAARRIRETGALPVADWLSSTRAGAPWVDFEWASQLLFEFLYRHGGFGALLAFKAAMMAASAYLLLKTLELYTDSSAARAAALALWGAASLTRSDIRPELFSLVGFSLVFLALERRRAGRAIHGPLWFFPLFCLWGNLHPGYVYGLALIGMYAAVDTSLWRYLAAAAAGSMLQAYGLAHLSVLWSHWTDMENIGARIAEWRPIRFDDPWYWPFWLAFFSACAAALLLFGRRKRPPLAPLAAVLFFGFSASRHSRMAAYSVACSVPLLAAFLSEAGALRLPRAAAGAIVLALGAFSTSVSLKYGLARTAFNDHFVPRRAAEFLSSRRDQLPHGTLYNPWGWGGYLGWRLYPDYRIFQDGRYIFHDLLRETGEALETPAGWGEFLDRRGVDLALMENVPVLLDGRPYYVLYMPREKWNLVYQDEQALIFARRQ